MPNEEEIRIANLEALETVSDEGDPGAEAQAGDMTTRVPPAPSISDDFRELVDHARAVYNRIGYFQDTKLWCAEMAAARTKALDMVSKLEAAEKQIPLDPA